MKDIKSLFVVYHAILFRRGKGKEKEREGGTEGGRGRKGRKGKEKEKEGGTGPYLALALLALKGDGRWNSHCFIARYAKKTPTAFRPTRFRFVPGARAIYPPS